MSKPVHKVVFLFPEHIGDFVVAIPVINWVIQNLKAEVDLYLTDYLHPLAHAIPGIGEIKPFPPLNSLADKLKLVGTLKNGQYDIACFNANQLINCVLLAGIPFLTRPDNLGAKLFGLIRGHDPWRRFDRNYSEILLSYFEALPAKPVVSYALDKRVRWQIAPDLEKRLADFSGEHGYTVIAPKTNSSKLWDPERWVELISQIQVQYRHKIILVGNGDDQALPALLSTRGIAPVDVLNLFNQTTFTELVSIIQKAAIVISNETGPAHLAGLFERKCIELFIPRDCKPWLWGTSSSQSFIVHQQSACTIPVCLRNYCSENRCWADISVDAVLKVYARLNDSEPVSREEWIDNRLNASSYLLIISTKLDDDAVVADTVMKLKQEGFIAFALSTGEYRSMTLRQVTQYLRTNLIRAIQIFAEKPTVPYKLRLALFYYRYIWNMYQYPKLYHSRKITFSDIQTELLNIFSNVKI